MATNYISDDFRSKLIEMIDLLDEEMGFESGKWEPTEERIFAAVKQYRRQMNHNRLKSKKDSKITSQLAKLPEAERDAIMRKLGLK